MRLFICYITLLSGLALSVGCTGGNEVSEPVDASARDVMYPVVVDAEPAAAEAKMEPSKELDARRERKTTDIDQPMNVDRENIDKKGIAAESDSERNAQPQSGDDTDADESRDRIDTDNTTRNKVDRGGQTLTPMDQSSDPMDIEITASIRRGLMDREGLSLNARNIKIITRDGRVTLRGVVDTTQEKRFVDSYARRTSGVIDIDNQLRVTGH